MMYYINLSFLFRSFSVHFYFFNTNIYILVASIWQEISVLWKRLQWGYVKMNKFPNYSQKKKPRVLLAFPRLSFFQFVPNKGIIIRLICYFLTSPQAFCFLLHKIFCFFHGETKKATGEQTICPRAMLHSYEAKKKKGGGSSLSFTLCLSKHWFGSLWFINSVDFTGFKWKQYTSNMEITMSHHHFIFIKI